MDGAAPPAFEAEWAFSDWLAANASLVQKFTAEREVPVIDRGAGRSFHNPVIEVYALGRPSGAGEAVR
jgi:predicted DNA repair protein MutK